LISCKGQKSRRVITGDLIAEGEISSDTVFNGDIKFYDLSTNKITIKAIYKNGKLNGEKTDYYLNGKIKGVGYYKDDKIAGTVKYYDSGGKLTSQQDFYYGLPVGSNIEYTRGKAGDYYFFSFEHEVLFYINYDSIGNIPTKEINDNRFFFYRIDSVSTIATTDKSLKWSQYFIYLINPPNFNFQYSLCIVNAKDSVIQIEKKFKNTDSWDTFTLDSTKLDGGNRFTLRMTYDRKMSEGKGESGDMRKRL
jgi:antitoxin component YwqK of YwqJK toxin-antitoxin module